MEVLKDNEKEKSFGIGKTNYAWEKVKQVLQLEHTVAVEEGATYLRVGTKIFGERNYMIKTALKSGG